jgi:predicted RNA-binding Zn-ribbon protein involved in translation (DUF1610 family)
MKKYKCKCGWVGIKRKMYLYVYVYRNTYQLDCPNCDKVLFRAKKVKKNHL